MGKLDRVIAVGALLCACSSERTTGEEAKPASAVPRAKAAIAAPERDLRFDAEGNLLPSSVKVGWFEVPLGFERVPGSTEQTAIFEGAGVTVAQLRKYVTARGRPERVEYLKYSENYAQLEPTHTQLPLPRLDVKVLYLDGPKRLRLVIEDHTPTQDTLSPQQAMEKLAKMRDRLE